MNNTTSPCPVPVRIALRRRVDLVIEEQHLRGVVSWVIKDPLALKYYRFSEEEMLIWSFLDSNATDEGIVRELHTRWPGCGLEATDVRDFAESLYVNGLALADSPRQGQKLKARHTKRRQQQRWQSGLNLLCIRLRGIDLSWLLRLIYPWISWFFRPVTICLVGTLAAVAGCVALLHCEALALEVVQMQEYFGAGSWLLLACVLAFTKMLHELGHALACRHCGGECHEIGVMLLVLTPCLYCDVSDSWLLPSKWQRAAIAAAGMYVEVTLASLAMLIWWWSTPGVLHYLSLQVILICSVSTLLFNGNPLTRYDGYYILADLTEVPDLRQRASQALKDGLAAVCLGIQRPAEREGATPKWLVAYAVASLAYRYLLLVTILWYLHGVCQSRGLEVLWQLLATLMLGTTVFLPLWRFVRMVRRQEVKNQMNRQRFMWASAVVVVAAGCFFFVPLPRRVQCTFETRPQHSVPITVTHDARLDCLHVVTGQTVAAGQRLAELSNLNLECEVARLRSEATAQRFRVASLTYEQFQNDDAMEALPQAKEILAATMAQLRERTGELERLAMLAPVAGVVLAPPRRERTNEASVLSAWAGTPLDEKNQNALLKSGEVICEIGDPRTWEAVVVIDQADIEHVQEGQDVRLLLDALSWTTLRGHVAEIAQQKLDVSPASLSIQSGGQLPTHTDRHGKSHPSSASYSVRVPIDAVPAPLAIGLRGTASIRIGSATLASRVWQYLCRTFSFA